MVPQLRGHGIKHFSFPSPFGEGAGVRVNERTGVSQFTPANKYHIILNRAGISPALTKAS